jgi:hypothetical protein
MAALQAGIGVEREITRRAPRGGRIAQWFDLRNGGRAEDAGSRRESGLAALATLSAGWILGMT